MRETAIRDVEGFSDPLVLQSLAYRVRAACALAAADHGRVNDHRTLLRASRFLQHARRGVLIQSERRLSATPTLDLLLAGYTRQAMVQIRAGAANGEFPGELDSLIASFDRAAQENGTLEPRSPWTLTEFDELWAELFRIASHAAADPTDVRLPDRSSAV